MNRPAAGLALMLLIGTRVGAEDWQQRIERACGEASSVVIGRVVRYSPVSHPEGTTKAVATIEVRRSLKGTLEPGTIRADFLVPSYLDPQAFDRDAILFLREQPGSPALVMDSLGVGMDAFDAVLEGLTRSDKTGRIPGMPARPEEAGPIAVSLGADDGLGRAVTQVRAGSLRQVRLLVQFENRGPETRAVMPCLYGSLWQSKYPHYELEIRDGRGREIPLRGFAVCGTGEEAPPRPRDVFSLGRDEAYRTTIPGYMIGLASLRLEPAPTR